MSGATPGVRAFQRPQTAIMTTVGVLVLLVLIYALVHVMCRRPDKLPWDDAIQFCGDGFEVQFVDENLVKYFSKAQILDLETRVNKDATRYSNESREWRRANLSQLPSFFAGLSRSDSPFGAFDPTDSESVDVATKSVDTVPLKSLREYVQGLLEPGTVSTGPTLRLRSLDKVLTRRIEEEDCERNLLQQEVKALEPTLSFGWLCFEGASWIFEIVAWTLIGVLANTVIALIKAKRDNSYDPQEFVLIVPKFFLAPVLSLVLVAMISSGVTEYGVTAINLPWMIVLGFALGFGTESLYGKLRDVTTAVIGRASISKEALEGLRRPSLLELEQAVLTVSARSIPPPRNLKELEKKLDVVLNSLLLKELVRAMGRESR